MCMYASDAAKLLSTPLLQQVIIIQDNPHDYEPKLTVTEMYKLL